MIRTVQNTLLTAFAIGLLAGESRADTITFSYNGNISLDGGDTSTGSGSITFTPASGAISLADVTAFSFTLITDLGFNFTYSGVADLSTFSLSSASPTATIDLVTTFAPSSPPTTSPENFTWTGALPGTGLAMAFQAPPNAPFNINTGPVTATYMTSAVAPEPSTLSLLLSTLALTFMALGRQAFLRITAGKSSAGSNTDDTIRPYE